MDEQAKRNYLLSAKQKYHRKQYQQLMICQQDSCNGRKHQIFQILVSQFVMVMNDESFQSIQSQSQKYPLPILYAAFLRCIQNKSYNDALKILHKHLEKQYNLNHHLITFNIAKIYEIIRDHRKSAFYYELVLKQKPLFQLGVFQYCKLLYRHGRKQDSLKFLKSHMISETNGQQSGILLQSLYINIMASQTIPTKQSPQNRISKQAEQRMNQALKFFHKRQVHPNVAFNIALYLFKMNFYSKAIQIFSKLQNELQPYYGQKAPLEYRKLLIFVRINLAKIYEIQAEQENSQKSKYRQIARIYEFLSKDLSFSDLIKQKHKKISEKIEEIQEKQRQNRNNECGSLINGIEQEMQQQTKEVVQNTDNASYENEKLSNTKSKKAEISDQIWEQQAIFAEKRKKNKQKLEYLLKKEKQVNQFFANLAGNPISIEKMKQFKKKQSNNELISLARGQLMSNQVVNSYLQFQRQFEQKKISHQKKYNKQQQQLFIADYLKENFSGNHFFLLKDRCKQQQKNDSQIRVTKSTQKRCRTSQKNFRITNKIIQSNDKIDNRQHKAIFKSSWHLMQKNKAQNNKQNQMESQIKNSSVVQQLEFEAISNNNRQINNEFSLIIAPKKQGQIKGEQLNIPKYFSIQQSEKQNNQANLKVQQNVNIQTDSTKQRFNASQQKRIRFEGQSNKQNNQEANPQTTQQSFMKNQKFNSTKDAIKQFQQSLFKNSTSSKSNWSRIITKKLTSNKNKNERVLLNELSQFQKALKVGSQLSDNKKYQQAYGHYTKMYKQFKQQPQKEEILLRIGCIFQIQEKYQQAEKTFQKCVKLNNAKAFMKLGHLQIRTGRVQQGVQNLQKANCIERYNTQIQTKLVYGYSLRQETVDKAFALASAILKRSPDSLDALIMSANILQKKGRIKQALEIAMAIDNQKQSFQIKHYIGVLYLHDSNVSMAFNYFQQALKIKPDNLPSLIEIGTILSDIQPQQAIKILKKVLQKDPQNRLALARLGRIYETQGDYDSAMSIYKKGLQVQQNYQSYIKIGDCLTKKESYVEAYLNYKQALMLKKTPQIYQRIAEVYKIQGQHSKAYESYQCALTFLYASDAKISERKRCLNEARKIAMTLQQFQNAVHCSRQVLDIEQSPQSYQYLGDAYYGKGDYCQALEYYQKAMKMTQEERQQEDWKLLEKIALCLDRNQEYLASKVIYEKIIHQFPDNVRALNNLACILLIIGQTNQAFYWFENVLLKVPNSIDKRMKVAENYAQVGDWSKVEYHLMICYKQKQNDVRIVQKLLNLYKQKRDAKQISKFEKKLNLLKSVNNKK